MSLEKINAAKKALEFVEEGMLVGLGSGSTASEFVKLLGEKIRNGFEVYGIPTSFDTKMLAMENEIPLIDPDEADYIDLCVDGADQTDGKTLIKGGGGALTREKVIAYNSKKFLIIIDKSKYVKKLNFPLPIEVVPFSYNFVIEILRTYGKPKLRMAQKKLGPVVTDNGNFIIDCSIEITNPRKREKEINSIPGVVENGIFTRFDGIILGNKNDAELKI